MQGLDKVQMPGRFDSHAGWAAACQEAPRKTLGWPPTILATKTTWVISSAMAASTIPGTVSGRLTANGTSPA